MRECAKEACDNPTVDKYCSEQCKTAADHAAQRHRMRVIENRVHKSRRKL